MNVMKNHQSKKKRKRRVIESNRKRLLLFSTVKTFLADSQHLRKWYVDSM